MGYNTWCSIPENKPLQNRLNILYLKSCQL